MKLKIKMAEAIVHDFIIEDNRGAFCLACGTFGGCNENIKHMSSCIVIEAKKFLLDENRREK